MSLAGRVARGVRPPAAQEIVELGKQHRVRTSYADVTQGPMARRIETLLESVPLLGTSRFRAGQQADVRAAADTVADAARVAMEQTPYSGIAATQRAAAQGHAGARNALQAANNAGDDWTRIVQASGNLKALRARQTAEQLYDRVEQLAAGRGAGPLTNTLDALQTASQQVGEAIIPDPQLTGVLRTLQDSLTNPQAQLAFSNIRQLRSDLGDIISDYYKNTNAIVGKKGVGHLTTIREAVEQDLEAFALSSGNPELIAAWKRADRFYRQEVVPFKDPQLAKALRNTHPDEVVRQVHPARQRRPRYAVLQGARCQRPGGRPLRDGAGGHDGRHGRPPRGLSVQPSLQAAWSDYRTRGACFFGGRRNGNSTAL